MSYKRKIYSILVVSIIAISISLALALPDKFGFCGKSDIKCLHDYIDRFNEIIQVIFVFFVPVIILSFTFLFLREQIFNIWLKFSLIFLPISIILVAITPSTSGGIDPIEREPVTFFLATIFLVVSLLIIAIKSIKLRGEGK